MEDDEAVTEELWESGRGAVYGLPDLGAPLGGIVATCDVDASRSTANVTGQ